MERRGDGRTPYNRALDLLAARSYSVRDLRRKLTQHGASAEEVDSVVERLIDAGLLDDQRYALAFARSKLTTAAASERRVQQELLRKGVPAESARRAVEQVVEDEGVDSRESIERLARKKLKSMGDLEPLVLRRRLYGFLARKGYDLDDIQAVMRTLLA